METSGLWNMKYTYISGNTYKLLKNLGSDRDSLMSVDNGSTDANSDSKVVNNSTVERITSTHVETQQDIYWWHPKTNMGWNNTFGIQMLLLGAEVHMSVHLASTLGFFGFHCHVLVSVSDTSFVWISGFVLKPIKNSFSSLYQIGFLVLFGKLSLKQ